MTSPCCFRSPPMLLVKMSKKSTATDLGVPYGVVPFSNPSLYVTVRSHSIPLTLTHSSRLFSVCRREIERRSCRMIRCYYYATHYFDWLCKFRPPRLLCLLSLCVCLCVSQAMNALSVLSTPSIEKKKTHVPPLCTLCK